MNRLALAPTVDGHCLSCDSGVAGQKQHGLCNVFGLNHPLQQTVGDAAFLSLFGPGLGPRCAHKTRCNGIDAHVGCQCVGQITGQINHACFACTIGNTAARHTETGDRGRVNDGAVCFLQMFGCRPSAAKWADQVGSPGLDTSPGALITSLPFARNVSITVSALGSSGK